MAITETNRNGEVLLSEANGALSREVVTIAAGQNLQAGAVLGKVSASGEYVAFDPAATDGSEAAAAVLLYDIDASAEAAKATAMVRLAEVASDLLVWPAGITAAQISTALGQLAGNYVIAR